MHGAATYSQKAARNRRTMEVLAAALASLPSESRRHSVLLVSRGFADLSDSPLYRETLLALQQSQAALYFLDMRTSGPHFSAEHLAPHPEEDEAIALQRHLGRPVTATGVWLSAESGGTKLGRGEVARAVEEARGYYLLGYEPPDALTRPGFRHIKVEVARPGLRVRARRGYDAAATATTPVDATLRRALASPPPAEPRSIPDHAAAAEVWELAFRHLEAAAATPPGREARQHIASGDRLAREAAAGDKRGETSLRDWLLASSWLLINVAGTGALEDAQQRLERARRLAPADAQVALALGMAHEARALLRAREMGLADERLLDLGRVRRTSALSVDDPLERDARAAERIFQEALDADPGLDEARLRLARVLQFRQRQRQAAAELERVAASSSAGGWAALAHLFLGDVEEQAGRSERALTHYRAALARTPSGQSVRITLSQALYRAGAVAEAATVMKEGLGSGTSASAEHDGWVAYYQSPLTRFLSILGRQRAAGQP